MQHVNDVLYSGERFHLSEFYTECLHNTDDQQSRILFVLRHPLVRKLDANYCSMFRYVFAITITYEVECVLFLGRVNVLLSRRLQA